MLTISLLPILAGSVPAFAAYPRPTRSQNGMVTSAHPLATQAGVEILRQGGNAVDAAVATTLAISVVEPFSAGIGGGGFMVTKMGKDLKSLDFRERAPQKASRNMYLDAQGKVRPNASLEGHLAAGVPGTIAGLAAAHQQYGKLPWRTVVAPAIKLARQGFIVSEIYTEQAKSKQQLLASNPAAREIFTRNGRPLQPGERLIQRDLARTLIAVARNPQNFYTGSIASAIDRDMRQNKGLITRADLQAYRPKWREPVCGKFRKYHVCSMAPPSSGGVHLIQILNTIGSTDLAALGWHSPDALHLLIESMRIAYADRSAYLGDPDFTKVPVSALTNPAYATNRRQEIDPQKARSSKLVRPATPEILKQFDRVTTQSTVGVPRLDVLLFGGNPRIKTPLVGTRGGIGTHKKDPSRSPESLETSHLNVVDRDRNVVSLTFTVNYRFGAGVVVPGTGILLNDEMDDFAIAPGVPNVFGLVGGDKNSIAPGKTPLSSMTPTIVTENGKFRLAVGAPGGSTIITTVLQILLNVLEYKMDVGAAVAAGRVHQQWLPDKVNVDPWGFDTATLAELRRRGHSIEPRSYWGNANAIQQLPDGRLEGAADPRGEGTARGF
ncbi:gamma-glutamyltransferase [Chamaesiphon sp. OTE_75_metabat_556]|uniref:gamma-glutamyltransferase n=1 Tax=Chamaesiphon sp. OTE_75_metabat_556 TaxID=2964692 RepID=UPI00286C235E|nr:gamma-glutamyltransferase [Chamaesiphon sp. OTE_75_metabat_556]